MPVLFAWCEANDIAWPDFFDRPTFALRPTNAGGNNQRLTERMRMPGRARTGLKRDARADYACRIGHVEHRIDAHRSGEPISWPFA